MPKSRQEALALAGLIVTVGLALAALIVTTTGDIRAEARGPRRLPGPSPSGPGAHVFRPWHTENRSCRG